MANILAKVDYFFADAAPEPAGWTETTYILATSIQQALVNAIADGYVQPRLNLLHPNYSLREVRVSDTVQLKDSQIFIFPGLQGQGQYNVARAAGFQDTSEEPYDGLLIRLESTSLRRRMFIMRGLPVNVVTRDRGYHPEAQWLNVFPLWVGAVKVGTAWQILLGSYAAVAPPDTMVVGADGRSLTFTWIAGVPPGIVGPSPGIPASTLKVSGEAMAFPTNKLWRVRRVQGNTVYTRPGLRKIKGVPALPIFMSLGSYAAGQVDNVIPIEGRSRRTGRPSDELRGKRAVLRG